MFARKSVRNTMHWIVNIYMKNGTPAIIVCLSFLQHKKCTLTGVHACMCIEVSYKFSSSISAAAGSESTGAN